MFVNSVFMAVLQLRDYNMYDTFTTAGLVLAHLFIILAVVIIALLVYKVIQFFNNYPKLS